MSELTSSSDQPTICAKCGFDDPEYTCLIRGMRYEKTTGLFAKQRHYTVTDVETPLCRSCADSLKSILLTQKFIIIAGAVIAGSFITYRLQQFVDPVRQFQWTWPWIRDMSIPTAIVSLFCGALLVVMTYWLFQWPWLRFTAIHAWLVQSGRATSGVKIIRGPRQNQMA